MKASLAFLLWLGIAGPAAAQREDLVSSYGMRDPMAFARRIYAHASAPELERAIDERREADALAIATLWAHDDLDAWLRAHRTQRVQQFLLYSPALLAGENPIAAREHLDWALSAGAPANACGFPDGSDPALGDVLARVVVRTTDDGCAYALDRGVRRAITDGTDVERASEAIDALVRHFADHPATLAAFMRFSGASDFFVARANLGATARDAWLTTISDRVVQNTRGDTKIGVAALVALASLGPDNAATDAALARLRGIDRRGAWSRAVHLRALEHHVRTRLASTPVVVDGTTQRRIADADRSDAPAGWMTKLLELWIGRSEDPAPWITHANGRLVAAPALVFMIDAAYRRGDLDAASQLATTVRSFRGAEARAWAHWYLAAIAARRREHDATASELLAALRYAARLPERPDGVRAMLEHHAIPKLAPWLAGHGRCPEAIELWRRWPLPPGCGLGLEVAEERRRAGLRTCGASP
jgi:hypothetical protein